MTAYLFLILSLLCLIYIIIGYAKGYTLTQLVTALHEWWIVGVVYALLAITASAAKISWLDTIPTNGPIWRFY